MRVVCIDTGNHGWITIGREYKVVKVLDSFKYSVPIKEYIIINDNDNEFNYADFLFMSLREYRKRKLEKIEKFSKL